jgi:hypothetical protein
MSLSEKYPGLGFSNLADRGDDMAPSDPLIQAVTVAGPQAVDRILEAVGKQHIPPNLDREALRIDIGRAYYSRDHAFDLCRGSEARDRVKRLRRWDKAVKELATEIEDDDLARAGINEFLKRLWPRPLSPLMPSSLPLSPPPIGVFLEHLQRAIAATERLEKGKADKWRNGHKHDPILRRRRPTEKEILAGVKLPLVFEWHFLKRAGRSRDKAGKPSGPMVKFIGATMKELGLPYSDEAIVRAYSLRAPLREEERRGSTLPSISRQI